MKKFFVILLSALFLFGAVSCGTNVPSDNTGGGTQGGTETPGGETPGGGGTQGGTETPGGETPGGGGTQGGGQQGGGDVKPQKPVTAQLIFDNKIEHGLNLNKQQDGVAGHIGELVYNDKQIGEKHYWDLCQWNSGYYHKENGKFPDSFNMLYAERTEENGTYSWTDQAGAKTFSVNPESGVFYMEINGSVEYPARRPGNEGFMTYVLNFPLDDDAELHVDKMNTLFFEFEFTLEKFEYASYADDQAQFVIYFILRNRDKSSKDYMQYLWFGLYPYDNRFTFAPDHRAFDTNTTGGFIYGIGGDKYLRAKPNVGEQNYFMFNLEPYARDALVCAQEAGAFKNTSFEQLEIEGGNLGWEVGGAYDVGMSVSMFNLYAEYRA